MDLPADTRTSPPVTASGPAPDIRGLVDNVTSERLFGWAFDAARPGDRLRLELRLDGETLSGTTAHLPRPDLAQNGVGDGAHAFEFRITPEQSVHAADFKVLAIAATGQEFPIPLRLNPPRPRPVAVPPPPVVDDRRIREDIAALARRVAELPDGKTLQTVLAQNAGTVEMLRGVAKALDQRLAELPDLEQINQLLTQQSLVAERLAALEGWLVRLDQRLVEPSAPTPTPARRRSDPWQVALFCALLGALAVAVTVGLVIKFN